MERLGDFPARIKDRAGYLDCLVMFHSVFAPLEDQLARFEDWQGIGIDFEARRRVPALLDDLAALGETGCRPTSARAGPLCFPEALGALYVLEGSRLGGRVILADISSRLGPSIDGATRFLAGHAVDAATSWLAFRDSLDQYATADPACADQVVHGAIQTFGIFADSMRQRSPIASASS